MNKVKYCNVTFDLDTTNLPTTNIYGRTRGYNPTKVYKYKTNIQGLKPGDLIVVPTRDTFSLARFIKYAPLLEKGRSNSEVRPIVAKVDLEEYEALLKKERERQEILAEMQQRKAQYEEELMYKMLAEKDPKMAELMERLNSLS